ncbi:MAG TPA: methyltransferase domain-containing protein [Chloroflexota bacterium]
MVRTDALAATRGALIAEATDFDRFARYYDWDTSGENDDLDFFRNLSARTGGPALEIGCGTGRVLLPLARGGLRLTAVDISPAMLARARAKLAAAGLLERVRLVETDARRMALDERFRLAFIALNTFMHFTTLEAQTQALERIHGHLVPGGLLALDLFNPHPDLLDDADGRLIHDFTRPGPDEGAVTTRFHSQRVDPATQTLEISFFYDEVGADGLLRRTVAPFDLHYFSRREVELLLERSGFAVEDVYGSHELDPYWAGSPKLIVVAARR